MRNVKRVYKGILLPGTIENQFPMYSYSTGGAID